MQTEESFAARVAGVPYVSDWDLGTTCRLAAFVLLLILDAAAFLCRVASGWVRDAVETGRAAFCFFFKH